jgi:hypothetical protein
MIVHCLESGKNVGELLNEFRRQIMVEKDAHELAVAVSHVGHLYRECVDRGEALS